MKIRSGSKENLFRLDGVPPFGEAFSLALQHVVALIVGCVTPAIIVANAAGLSQADRVILIQAALTVSAISTLFQLFPIKLKWLRFGSGLPIIMGISFAYVPSMQAIAVQENGLAMIAGAMVVGGAVALVIGFFAKRIRKFFPPLITGTVVFTIGLSLYPTAINYMAGGSANTYDLVVGVKGLSEALVYGSWQNWTVAAFTLIVVVALNNFGKGICKLASILIGMAAGYALAACFGMVSFTEVAQAGWFAPPQPLHFGISFDPAACVTIGLLFAINSIQAIGDFTATTAGGLGREPTNSELQGGIVCYGALNMVGALFCGLPTATYSQNVGIVSTTKVVNRIVLAIAAGMILLAGLLPKFSAVLTTIPQCVLGGATITVFSSIAMTGMKLLTGEGLTSRSSAIVGLSAALGVGVAQASDSIAQMPEAVAIIIGKSPVVLATVVAIVLNLILPKEKKELSEEKR
ncbi:MAG TPA: nucleobase:cation symporter-2 family protein [Eubacteriales bacterium]|nr:nucleobase:cation symporter-2 family protein [Clostridia bacterium]HRV73493.1 nucleobase:cation symporter-2 family protein [Eubacteriales bacterium]